MNSITSSSQLILHLKQLPTQNFTGSLLIEDSNGLIWKIYFRLGRLIWCQSKENHFQNQWKRNVNLFLSDLNDSEMTSLLNLKPDRYYKILAQLYNQGDTLQKENVNNLVKNIIGEVIFDLIQYSNNNKEKLSYQIIPNDKLEALVSLVKADLVYQKVLSDWKKWVAAGLIRYSPNFLLRIEDIEKIEEQLNPKLISFIDEQSSLRDLAFKSDLNLLTITQSLLPCIQIGAISLQDNLITKEFTVASVNQVNKITLNSQIKKSQLIICIDDSSVICRDIEKIISKTNYHFMNIQNPLKAMPLIIKNSPDFIFLDLMMPIINGYELCAQIRKIPSLKDIPIVILTAKDGLVDRVRAKVVGANAFLSKPPNSEEILCTISKYLSV